MYACKAKKISDNLTTGMAGNWKLMVAELSVVSLVICARCPATAI